MSRKNSGSLYQTKHPLPKMIYDRVNEKALSVTLSLKTRNQWYVHQQRELLLSSLRIHHNPSRQRILPPKQQVALPNIETILRYKILLVLKWLDPVSRIKSPLAIISIPKYAATYFVGSGDIRSAWLGEFGNVEFSGKLSLGRGWSSERLYLWGKFWLGRQIGCLLVWRDWIFRLCGMGRNA